jgi:hypothetical protein
LACNVETSKSTLIVVGGMRQRLSTEIRWQLRRNDFVRGGAGPKENGRFGDVLLPRCHVAILPTAIWFKAGGGVDGSPAASRSARRRRRVKTYS